MTWKPVQEKRSVLIMDYEGEMPGHGGELVTAALLPTHTVDRDSLRVVRTLTFTRIAGERLHLYSIISRKRRKIPQYARNNSDRVTG